MTKNHQLPLMLILALIAVVLLIIIISLNIQSSQLTNNERLLVGSLFILISACGIYSAYRPGRLRRLLKKPDSKSDTKKPKSSIKLAGHHPTCKPFENHTFLYKNTVFCTGCYGLAIGSLFAICTTIIYLTFNIIIRTEYSLLLLSIGLLLLFLNYIETLWYHNTIILHLMSNSLLVIGFLLIVISTIELTGETSFGIIAIIFSVLWLDVRIHLSQYKHRRICQSCPNDCIYFR